MSGVISWFPAEVSGVTFSLGSFSLADGAVFPGVVVGEHVIAVKALAPLLGARGIAVEACASVQSLLDIWPRAFPALQEVVGALRDAGRGGGASGGTSGGSGSGVSPGNSVSDGGELRAAWHDRVSLGHLRVHAPIPRPGTIYCSGANYKKHVAELIVAHQNNEHTLGMSLEEKRAWAMSLMDKRAASGTPFVFVKPLSSLTGPFDEIAVPEVSQKPDWELELAVVIGRRARRVSRADALSYVAGYTIANDVTLREKVFRRKSDSPELGMDFVMSKGAPTFLPLGPFLVPSAFVSDPQSLQLTLKLNGRIMQDESTADMIFTVAHLIEYLSAGVELQPGDVICTGSPAGNGMHYGRFIQAGDEIEASITHLGAQRNRCVSDRS